MCGISGVFQIGGNNKSVDNYQLENIINQLISSVKLRGPNNTGKIKLKCGFLGHTRLAIRDLSVASNQPVKLINKQGSFVYNGEIYNNLELLKKYSIDEELSDTLTLKKLFEYKNNISFINELIGDFAIAFWDDHNKKLFLIRDHIGKKPLYYSLSGRFFLFNSSIKGIQKAIKSKLINNEALANYLVYGNMFDEKSIFKEIKQVLPGQIIIWDSNTGRISSEKFFNLRDQILQSPDLNVPYKELTKILSQNIEEVIKSHLCSDVPISILLSSGIDSKAVARYSLSANLKAYTADFKENHQEIIDSKKFSNHFEKLDHEIVRIKEFDILKILEEIIDFIGEPFADASVIPLYYLYKNLPKDRKVVLQGDGGDELFGGYKRYQFFSLLSKFPNINFLRDFNKFNFINDRVNRLFFLSTLKDENLYKNIMTSDYKGFNTIFYFKDYLKKEKIDINNLGSSYLRDFKNTNGLSIKEQLSAIDFINQLPNQFLYKVDRISMMNGIEARVPLVDIRLIKLVFSINQKSRFKKNPPKRIFRDSIDIPNYLKFTPKRGFGTPISKWLDESRPNIKSNILSAPFLDFFMLDKKNVKNLLNINKYSQIESYSLWKILCLSIWFNKVFDSEY